MIGKGRERAVARGRVAHLRRRAGHAASVALLALVVSSPPASGDARPAWWSYERAATFDAIQSEVFIPARDGTLLNCTLSLPGHGGAVAPGRHPGLITNYTPYGGLPATPATFWAEHGYAAMVCDVRGTGQSGGVYSSILAPIEAQDNYDLIEWMASQPWSDGRIGQTGVSYGGMTSFRVAALQPPHLRAIAPEYSQDNLYLNDVYRGGIETTPGSGDFWPALALALSGGRVNPAQLWLEYHQHPRIDAFWKQIMVASKYGRIKVPVLQVGGWNDTLLPGGAPGNYIGLKGRVRNWLIMGPWAHASQSPEPLGDGYLLAWFDHWLMQIPNAPLPSARVTSYEQPVKKGGQGWKQLANWPPPGNGRSRLYFTRKSGLASAPGAAATEAFTTRPEDTPATPSNGRIRLFATAPLSRDLVVAGRVAVHLKAALNASDGNLKTILYDVAPDGTATFVNDGYLKASHRFSHERTTPVTPGRRVAFDIDVWPTHWRFVKGHKLRLQVFGGESTQFVPESSAVTTTVAVGEGGSYADVPVGDASKSASRGCLARRSPIGARNIGRIRLGLTRRALLRRVPAPRRRTKRSWRWCVKGGKGAVWAAFTRKGRVSLVVTTAPRHGNRHVRPGTRVGAMRRAYPRSRAIGRTLVRLSPRSLGLFGIRRGKVRYIAVASRSTVARRRTLRAYLRYAGM